MAAAAAPAAARQPHAQAQPTPRPSLLSRIAKAVRGPLIFLGLLTASVATLAPLVPLLAAAPVALLIAGIVSVPAIVASSEPTLLGKIKDGLSIASEAMWRATAAPVFLVGAATVAHIAGSLARGEWLAALTIPAVIAAAPLMMLGACAYSIVSLLLAAFPSTRCLHAAMTERAAKHSLAVFDKVCP